MLGLPTVGAIRRPEHTGAQRCWPCTVVNAAVLVVVVAALVVLAGPVVAALAGALGALAIWLRGYVVPGTPRFAPPLVAALPGGEALFHAPDGADARDDGPHDAGNPPGGPEEAASLGAASDVEDGEAVLEALVAAGAVEVDAETVALAPAVEETYADERAALASLSTTELAAAVDTAVEHLDARAERDADAGRDWVALGDGEHALAETWLRRPVAIADLAAVRALEGYLPADQRLAAARSLRSFLEDCPDCGTPLEDAAAVPCCGGYNGPDEVPAETRVCPECEARLVTLG